MQKSRMRLKKDKETDDTPVLVDTPDTEEEMCEGESPSSKSNVRANRTQQSTSESPSPDTERAVYEAYLTGLQMPRFIFHAAGHCGKLECLRGVMQKRGMEVPAEFLSLSDFKISKGDRTANPSHLLPP